MMIGSFFKSINQKDFIFENKKYLKTKNYDKYKKRYKQTKEFIDKKTKDMESMLQNDEFKKIYKNLENIKRR